MANWEQLNFQNSISPYMKFINNLHHHIMSIMLLVLVVVLYIMIYMMFNNKMMTFKMENHTLETIWTLLPGIILMFIALPSLKVLYVSEESFHPIINLKTIGHQWYWSYEYSDFENIEFDSFMVESNKRLIEVDNRIVLPYKLPMQVFVTSADVLHSWALPSLGVKVDANPGRLNQTFINSKMPAIVIGQCSELCGVNHSFMPIIIEFTNIHGFKTWLNNML